MCLQPLTQTAPPWIHLLVAPAGETWNLARTLEQTTPLRVAARVLRGRKATTVNDFFDECAAALQFPGYFGDNWDAVYDCLCDLSWLRADAVVICVADAIHLLEAAPAEQTQRFLAVVSQSLSFWNQARTPKTARPFHWVLQASPAEEMTLVSRWQALGVTLNRLAP